MYENDTLIKKMTFNLTNKGQFWNRNRNDLMGVAYVDVCCVSL